jgi:hypothetical protein
MGIDATLGHAQTVGEWMQSHWGSLARLGSPGIWFKPALINNILTGPGDREGELMHELFHNLGLDDGDLFQKLGLTGTNTGVISNRMRDDCFK